MSDAARPEGAKPPAETAQPSFWNRVGGGIAEKGAVAIIALVANKILEKEGGIDVVKVVYCWIGKLVDDPLRWNC